MPFGKVKYTEVISPSEGQAAMDAAAGKIDPSAAEKELHAQEEWNNPYENERRRAEELKKQAQKVRNKKTKKIKKIIILVVEVLAIGCSFGPYLKQYR